MNVRFKVAFALSLWFDAWLKSPENTPVLSERFIRMRYWPLFCVVVLYFTCYNTEGTFKLEPVGV